MRPCRTAPLFPPSEHQPLLKKSKRSPDSLWPSKSSKTDIDDLPDSVLVEILCLLPLSKVLRCISVCKRWSSLISDEKFRSRFLWVQSHSQKLAPLQSTLIFRDAKDKSAFFISPELELPRLKSQNFSLPRLQGATDYITTSDDGPIVVGTCKDLVLLCEEVHCQREYYIWNPYTKQIVCLPPTPRCYSEARVGFICEPYYKDDQKEESITSSGMIHIDADYSCAVVRICPEEPSYTSSDYFKLEIFSSKTCKWTESLIRSPRKFCFNAISRSGGIACNGMLYWLCPGDGFVLGFDHIGYSNNNNNKTECSHFHIIDAPYQELNLYTYDTILKVCRGGRLRICLFSDEDDDAVPSMSVLELKDDGRQWWEVAGDLDLDTMVYKNPVVNDWRFCPTDPRTLAFDPNNEHILYLELFDHIVACDIHERKIIDTALPSTMCTSTISFGQCVFPLVLPRWPTPLPELKLD